MSNKVIPLRGLKNNTYIDNMSLLELIKRYIKYIFHVHEYVDTDIWPIVDVKKDKIGAMYIQKCVCGRRRTTTIVREGVEVSS